MFIVSMIITLSIEWMYVTAGSCPDGDDWKFFNKNCYFLNKDLLSWQDANDFCNSKGAHLVSIQSSLQNSFVRAIVSWLIFSYSKEWKAGLVLLAIVAI